MRFARAPYAVADARGWLMGDLRYDMGPKPSCSDIDLSERAGAALPCTPTPPWIHRGPTCSRRLRRVGLRAGPNSGVSDGFFAVGLAMSPLDAISRFNVKLFEERNDDR